MFAAEPLVPEPSFLVQWKDFVIVRIYKKGNKTD
jgi:hypothetical protein